MTSSLTCARDILRTSSTPYGNFTSLAAVAVEVAPVDGVAGVSWANPCDKLSAAAKEAISVVLEIPFFIAEQVNGFVRLSQSI